MDADTAKKLRASFPAEIVGKLPRVTCRACSDNKREKHCDKHQRRECRECGNYITTAHMHLDYVGHAAITDRLLQADPTWTWEPVAFGPDGLPLTDKNGGLWIRLTVGGVTRLGFGDAAGKQGPDAVKEAIGDALRNAAMRFGVALDLWHKDGTLQQDDEPAAAAPASAPPQQRQPEAAQESGADAARKRLKATCAENGWDLAKVAAVFAVLDGGALKDADTAKVTKFREHLFTLPQADLMPATNGVAA